MLTGNGVEFTLPAARDRATAADPSSRVVRLGDRSRPDRARPHPDSG